MAEEVDDFLAHYGVKGMKWGVRRKRTVARTGKAGERYREATQERNAKKLTRLDRLSKGEGTLRDKAYLTLTVTNGELAAGRGLKGAANVRATKIRQQDARLQSGRTTVRDKLQMVMMTPTADLLVKRVDR